MHWCKILAFCVAFIAGTYAQTRVEFKASAEVTREGEVITFTCLVYNLQPAQFVRWSKMVDQVEKPIDLATNNFLEASVNTGRFEAKDAEGTDPVVYQWKIKDISTEDQGRYGCSVPTTTVAITDEVSLIVLRDIETFDFTLSLDGAQTRSVKEREEIKFRNDDPLTLICSATESFPKPEVNITVGGKLVDEDLVQEEVDKHYRVIDPKLGTTEQWVSVTKRVDTRIKYTDMDKTVRCTVGLPNSEKQERMSRGFIVKMDGVPPMINCASEWTAWEDADDQVILCNVTAKPPIFNASVTYYRNKKTVEEFLEVVTLTSNGRYSLTLGPDGSYVALHIRKVFMQDFRKYSFTVVNDAGDAHHVVNFIRAESNGQYSVNVELSTSKANVGDNLEATCSVSSDVSKGNSEGELDYMIVWVKRVENTEVEIATNSYINSGFSNTGRYSAEADYEYDDDEQIDFSKITFRLIITGVQPQDSGQIGCRIPQQKIEVFRQFTVFVNVQSILLNSIDVDGTHAQSYNDKKEVTFDEGHVRKFYCHVNGSFPKPDVTITIGGRNITDQFKRDDKVLAKGLMKGLKEISYAVTLKNEAFVIDYSFSNKRLECRATVPGSEFQPKQTGILIKLAGYKPKFVCNKTVVVNFLQEDVHITCLVHADPALNHFKIFWESMPHAVENTSLEGNSSDGHFEAIIENGTVSTEKTMILKIDRIFQQHFRRYYFEAGNTLGLEVWPVDLIQGPGIENNDDDNNDVSDEIEETGGGADASNDKDNKIDDDSKEALSETDKSFSVDGGASLAASSMLSLLLSFILWKAGIEC